jgi:predicted DNA binding CopG/RHH family protein
LGTRALGRGPRLATGRAGSAAQSSASTISISLRLPVSLLESIKIAADKRDVPYQSLIKMWLAEKAG